MIPYVILVGTPALLSIISKKLIIGKNRNYVVSSFFIIFIALLSMRGLSVGNDTANYSHYYDFFSSIAWRDVFSTEIEPAYAVFNKIIASLGVDYQMFLTIVSFIAIVPIWRFYIKDSDAHFLTISLFLCLAPFNMYFSGLRQILAMVFSFPAFYYSRKKKPVYFILTVLAAFQFHRSAFILLFMYPLCRLKITFKWLWGIIPSILIIFVFNRPIFAFLADLIGDLYTADMTTTGAYAILGLLVLLAVYSYFMPDEQILDDNTISMRNILLMCVILQCFASVNALAMRMNYYYLPFVPLLITKIADRVPVKNKKLAVISIIIMTGFFTMYFFYSLSKGGGLSIYPYVPYWSEL